MNFLIGVDGSAASLDAVRLAAGLVDPARDAVTIYFSPLELEKRLAARARVIVEGAEAALFEEVCKLLPAGMARAPELVCSSKSPAVGLLQAAAERHADLIVVGARGHGSIERFLLGSVSRAVVHGATLPVLVARTAPPDGGRLKALVCHHAASARAVATLAGQLHWPAGTDGRVIGVAESMLAGPIPAWLERRTRDPDTAAIADAWRKEHDAEVATLGDALAAFEKTLPVAFHGHRPIVTEGNPGERILEQAKAEGVDLIVLGRTPSDPLSRWLLGSTSEAVLTHAHASVLIVPVQKS
jgi:nucleotide-binding universal stress UspA family protein